MKKALEIKNLSFSYDKQVVLENINLTVNQNDFLAIIGPNGGGKSTLLKLILGINNITKGSIEILEENHLKNLVKVGYVPQNTNVNIDFPITVHEVVLMGHNQEKSKTFFNFGYNKQQKQCALNSLKKVGMEKYASKKIGSLSGGQRQRVMIARALCSNPEVLLLDEPTASIDVNGQKQIYELLKELNKNITVVVVSHDISVILGFASKVAHINKKLSYHDISSTQVDFNSKDEHFCEVELLQMLSDKKDTIKTKSCGC
ncbi:MAG: ABC transporter ATP-binding protein [Campylobacterota bacterium]|nr:ABC transporter ATP-binding protein [Campylobacterota bacterium]